MLARCVQVHAALFGNQRRPILVRRCPLQLHLGVVLDIAVKDRGSHRHLGRGVRILLISPPLQRMVQAVNMRVCLQGHISTGNILTVVILFDRVPRGFQRHAGGYGDRGAVDAVHYRHGGAGRNIFLRSIKGILQTRQFAPVDKPGPVIFLFQLFGKLITFRFA